LSCVREVGGCVLRIAHEFFSASHLQTFREGLVSAASR
jgi:hypothetical protein